MTITEVGTYYDTAGSATASIPSALIPEEKKGYVTG